MWGAKLTCAYAIGAIALLSGCGLRYYDRATGTENVWGLGHLQMKLGPTSEGVRAGVTGTEIAGLGVGVGSDGSYLTLGFDRRRHLAVLDDNTQVRLAWPSADFFSVRVGSEPPFLATDQQGGEGP